MARHNKFLIFIIGMALLIGLMSSPDNPYQTKTPWNIQPLIDGRVYVFGITPGKTTIQEANQILGHFAETRLYNTEPPQLLATHERLILGDDKSARIDLLYFIDDVELAAMQQTSPVFSPCQYIKPTLEQEIELLNTPVSKLIYTPVTDYSAKAVKRQLGDADTIEELNEKQQIMRYKKFNLTVYINSDKPDVFVYDDVAQPPVPGNTD